MSWCAVKEAMAQQPAFQSLLTSESLRLGGQEPEAGAPMVGVTLFMVEAPPSTASRSPVEAEAMKSGVLAPPDATESSGAHVESLRQVERAATLAASPPAV